MSEAANKKSTGSKNAPTSREKLKSFVERIVGLEDEKKAIANDIKDIYSEAKNDGFDPKALRKIVKEWMQTQTQRAAERETEALVDIYRANLGLLDGTPLGEAARRKYERELRDVDEDSRRQGDEDGERHDEGDAFNQTTDEARDQGRKDHGAGKRIVDNPFPAATPNRAAWDEGWCEADGSDGMDLPKAWRRGEEDQKQAAE